MNPNDHNITTFEAMFTGHVDALHRFEAAAKAPDPVMTYVPLFEALNWAYALDDRTAKHFAPEGKPLGLQWRTRIPEADIMGGVRFARNSVHHQWSDALRLDTDGRQYPKAYPLVYFEWVWRSADELPESDKPLHPDAERCYRDRMEGRAARVCLDVLGGVFLTLQRLLEPNTIVREPAG
jgi:hypothetical protein